MGYLPVQLFLYLEQGYGSLIQTSTVRIIIGEIAIFKDVLAENNQSRELTRTWSLPFPVHPAKGLKVSGHVLVKLLRASTPGTQEIKLKNTMAHEVTTFLFGNLNLSLRYDGSSKTGTQQISTFVLGIALDSPETLPARQEVGLSYDE